MSIGIGPNPGSNGIVSGAVSKLANAARELPVVGGLAKGLSGSSAASGSFFGL